MKIETYVQRKRAGKLPEHLEVGVVVDRLLLLLCEPLGLLLSVS